MVMTPQTLEYSIRFMTRRDVNDVLRIDRASYVPSLTADELVEALSQHDCLALVADSQDEIIGYIIYHLAAKKIIVSRIAVAPEYRRLSVASALLERVLSKMSIKGRSQTEMILSDQNLLGHVFLRSAGFLATAILHDYTEDGEDAYLFQYAL